MRNLSWSIQVSIHKTAFHHLQITPATCIQYIIQVTALILVYIYYTTYILIYWPLFRKTSVVLLNPRVNDAKFLQLVTHPGDNQ